MTATKLVSGVASLALLAMLAFAAPASANPFGGSLSGVHRAPAFGAGVHTIIYNGGERADFRVDGDGDTTLNIIVKDANGNTVIQTTGAGDHAHVYWTPSRTSVYTIYVVNSGSVYNQYSWRAY